MLRTRGQRCSDVDTLLPGAPDTAAGQAAHHTGGRTIRQAALLHRARWRCSSSHIAPGSPLGALWRPAGGARPLRPEESGHDVGEAVS